MCFNGIKTWQLGWHSTFHTDLPIGDNYNWQGNLVGFADKSLASSSDQMIIRIRGYTDYYVRFNRKIGMNNGTQEGGNPVLVASRARGTGLAISDLVAKLSSGESFTIPNFNYSTVSLTLAVAEIDVQALPARANISVQFALSAPPFVYTLPCHRHRRPREHRRLDNRQDDRLDNR